MTHPAPARTNCADFLARIRTALARGQGPIQPPPAVDPLLIRTVPPKADPLAIFQARAAEAGLHIHPTTAAATPAHLATLLIDLRISNLAIGAPPLPPAPALLSILAQYRITPIDWRSAPGFDALYDADAGLTGVHAAIAESATLVCPATPASPRGLSLVPPIHIAVVLASQVVPDLADYLLPGPSALPSSIAFISGPSKTADIEGILITGVHGPREVHVLLVADA